MSKRKNKRGKNRKQVYRVMWSYYDHVGTTSGVVQIKASSREEAEKVFYKLNRSYVIRYDEKTKTRILNPRGGYVCESVLTESEWVDMGKPTRV